MTLLIDDPAPFINPLYYFASQVPKDSVDYHYKKKSGKWYFDSDSDFKYPIPDRISQEFVTEFAAWTTSNEVKGKISIIPYPAGLGRIDRRLAGVRKEITTEFVSMFRDKVSKNFDIGPEMLTHTRPLGLKNRKLVGGVSEHDWSQKQSSETLAKYLSLALKILKNVGLKPSGVTSPCNFGMYVEGDYVNAISEASRKELALKVPWYFLHVDSESLVVNHRLMLLNREEGEAVVSLVGSMNDPLWTSQMTDLDYDAWARECIDPILANDGSRGRIWDLVERGSYVTIVTHWQSLYSNGSRYGLRGLGELVSRINETLRNKIHWMRCTEIADYVAFSSSALLRAHLSTSDERIFIEISSPFRCKDVTFSFMMNAVPSRIVLNSPESLGQKKIGEDVELEKLNSTDPLKPNSWMAIEEGKNSRIVVCIGELNRAAEKVISYGVTKKTNRKTRKEEYFSSVAVLQ